MRDVREMRMETNNHVTNSVWLDINFVLEGILKGRESYYHHYLCPLDEPLGSIFTIVYFV